MTTEEFLNALRESIYATLPETTGRGVEVRTFEDAGYFGDGILVRVSSGVGPGAENDEFALTAHRVDQPQPQARPEVGFYHEPEQPLWRTRGDARFDDAYRGPER